jgi:phenylpropionate dioxygenase-like ring-hydroxylating dioxygenase large terminal subunit
MTYYANVQRAEMIDVTRKMLDLMASNTLEIADEPATFPGSCFTDPAWADAERERLFLGLPHVVGHAGEVREPGSFVTKDVAGVPVLLVRAEDGLLRAFLNSCAHRGATLASGSGCASRFTCGYHAWSYNALGELVGRPAKAMFDGIDPSGLGLQPLPVAEEQGLLVVGLRPDLVVDGWLDSIAPALAGFRFEEYVPLTSDAFSVAANWKLTVDVNFEGYHFPFLHRNSLDPIATGNATFDLFGRHCRWVFPLRGVEQLRGVPEDEWPERALATVVHLFFPSCVLIEAPGAMQLLRVYPGSHPGESFVDFAHSLHAQPSPEEREGHLLGFQFANDLLRGEDFPMAEACQRGLAGGRDRIVAGRNEPLIQHLHREWADAMCDRA